MTTVVGVHPVTGGLPVQNPSPFVSVVVSLGKTPHLPCVLVVVRGSGGAEPGQLNFYQAPS